MNKLKIYTFIYTLFLVAFVSSVFAQSAFDLSGVFEGKRSQYDADHTSFVREFTYKFELKQKGNIVTGISTIINDEGNYAEVGLRGIVIDDLFYFEEFEMLDQIKAANSNWCYKSGVLSISSEKNEIILSGETPSYMVDYGIACTGGFTMLSAREELLDEQLLIKKNSIENAESILKTNIYPNPSSDYIMINISFEENTTFHIEVYDLSGKVMYKTQSKTNHSQKVDISQWTNGLYILKVSNNNNNYSEAFIKK